MSVDGRRGRRQVGGKFSGPYYSASSLEEMVGWFVFVSTCPSIADVSSPRRRFVFCGLLLLLLYHSCHKLTRSKERFSLH